MVTSTTKQLRKACFTTNYRNRGRLAAKLVNKREKAGGDGGFTVLLQQPSNQEEKEVGAPELISTY